MQQAPLWARDRALVRGLAMVREQVPELERASEQETALALALVRAWEPEMERVMGKAQA